VESSLQAAETRTIASAVAPDASPLAMWHLLSLDAPTVAALWTWFIARTSHVVLPPCVPAAMFVAVWLLYAADRLLDSWCGDTALEARHYFHQRHQHRFVLAIGAGAAILAALVLKIPRLLFLTYFGLATLLLAWFAVVHSQAVVHKQPSDRAERLPKELAVGAFFSAAVFAPSWLAADSAHDWLLLASLGFSLLCALNCLSIYAWEHARSDLATAHSTTRLGVRLLRPLTLATLAALLAASVLAPADVTPMFVATAGAAALLLGLDHLHRGIDPINIRAAADLVLLTPLLIVALMR